MTLLQVMRNKVQMMNTVQIVFITLLLTLLVLSLFGVVILGEMARSDVPISKRIGAAYAADPSLWGGVCVVFTLLLFLWLAGLADRSGRREK